jgi:hypothetical protein
MYRVWVETSTGIKKHELTISTEKFQQLLGRYLLKYGSPMQTYTEKGLTELDYCTDKKGLVEGVIVTFVNIGHDKKKESIIVPPSPPACITNPPPRPSYTNSLFDKTIDPALQEFVDKGAVNTW